MNRYIETQESWNNAATWYEDTFMHFGLYNDSYVAFCNQIHTEKATILDVGCGPGNITQFLTSVRPIWKIHGIDTAKRMIELAQKNNPRATFSTVDARNIASLKTKYDGIIAGFCLPYLSENDSKKFITDCYQSLTENGILYISFVEGKPEESGLRINSKGDKMYFHYYQQAKMKQWLETIKFTILKIYTYNYHKSEHITEIHTIFIVKK